MPTCNSSGFFDGTALYQQLHELLDMQSTLDADRGKFDGAVEMVILAPGIQYLGIDIRGRITD